MSDERAEPVPAPLNLFGAESPADVVHAATEAALPLARLIRERGWSVTVAGKEHVKLEGWTLLASMLGVYPVVEWTRSRRRPARWEARVVATALTGSVVGVAEADYRRGETGWDGRDDAGRGAVAEARATARALRLPLGFVMSLAGFETTAAEEVEAVEEPEVVTERLAEPTERPRAEGWLPEPVSVVGVPVAGTEGAGAGEPSATGWGRRPAEPEQEETAPSRRERRGPLSALQDRPHSPRRSLQFSMLVLVAAAVAYGFTQWGLPRLLSDHPDYNFYLVQPVVWTAVAALAVYGWLRLEERPRFSRLLMGIAFVVGIFHVALLVLAGVVWGFGDSPIAHRLINYPKNLLYITTLLAGLEAARAYLFQVWQQRRRRWAFGAVTLLFFAVAIPAGMWTPFGTIEGTLRVAGGRWGPALALSVLCTYLVSYGGLGPSFAYRFPLLAFEWFSPILPDLTWLVVLAIGLVAPLISSWLVPALYRDTVEGQERKPSRRDRKAGRKRGWGYWTGWAVTLALVALAVLFAVGVFGYSLQVISGISMEPAYSRGDVAVVHEGVDSATLELSDVIVFRQGNVPFAHRIVAIEEGAEGRMFTTKGDNVDSADPPVSEDRVEGKVVFIIPWVGHLSLWARGG